MNAHVERYDSHALEAYYATLGAKFVGQTGSHRKWALPDGRVLPSCISSKSVATTAMARAAAKTLGLSLEEFRVAVGYPTPRRHGKSHGKPVAKERNSAVTKAEALRACVSLCDAAKDLHSSTAQGMRDGRHYALVASAATRALAALKEASP